jgi:hypothetical protein
MQDKNGKVIAYSAYNPNTGKNIIILMYYFDSWLRFQKNTLDCFQPSL